MLIICAFLCSCGNKAQSSTSLQTVFECDFAARYNETELGGRVAFDENGAKITLAKPDTLKGVCLEMKNGQEKIRLSANGLSIDFDEKRYPSAAFVRLICKAVFSGGGGLRREGESNALSGSADGIGFEFTVDDSGRPKTLNIPDYSLKMDFTNYKQ